MREILFVELSDRKYLAVYFQADYLVFPDNGLTPGTAAEKLFRVNGLMHHKNLPVETPLPDFFPVLP